MGGGATVLLTLTWNRGALQSDQTMGDTMEQVGTRAEVLRVLDGFSSRLRPHGFSWRLRPWNVNGTEHNGTHKSGGNL
jgi:Ser/Thr protein kinase RdoA (MazF antagonist)